MPSEDRARRRRQRPRPPQSSHSLPARSGARPRGLPPAAQPRPRPRPRRHSWLSRGWRRSPAPPVLPPAANSPPTAPDGLPPLPPSPAELRQRQRAPLQLVPDLPAAPSAKPPTPAKPTFLAVFALYTTRLLIASVGLGAIAGTLIATLDSTRHGGRDTPVPTTQPEATALQATYPPALASSQELTALKTELAALFEQYPQYEPGVFLIDLDTGAYLDWQAAQPFPAASTIKAAILVAFFQAVDAGELRLDEPLTLTAENIAGEAGDLQYQAPGTQFTALETAVKMIVISDNTATNMLIERLGGFDALNQTFATWGLKATRLENWLPDLAGTNTTSPLDLANLMAMVNRGELLSLSSRDRLLGIMRQVEHADLLPPGLEEGATIAHKTGRIGPLLADAGLIDTPTGTRYIAAVMVKRPDNDEQAVNLIQTVSRLAYEHFNHPRQPAPTATQESLDANDSVATKEDELQ